jgi:hypothetical protein
MPHLYIGRGDYAVVHADASPHAKGWITVSVSLRQELYREWLLALSSHHYRTTKLASKLLSIGRTGKAPA